MKKQIDKTINKVQSMSHIQRALIGVCGTDDGRDVLRHLLDICGFQKPSVVASSATGEVVLNNVVYNEARRNVYLEIRRLIPERHLKIIEHTPIKQKGADDDSTL